MGYFRIVMLLVAVVVLGCSESRSVTPPAEVPAVQAAKGMLEEIGETGELGSGAMELRENLEKVDGSQSLLSDLDALEGLTDPAQIKEKAKAMASKL